MIMCTSLHYVACVLGCFILLQTHLPGYVEKAAALKTKGVEVIACIAVNDPFVMEAWGKAHNADGQASFFCQFQAFMWNFHALIF